MKDVPMRRVPQQSRSQRRIDLVLDTAAELFAEVGYESATTNAIADRAGISIGSLYRYFPDKDAILRALANRYYEQVHALYGEVFTGDLASMSLPALIDQLLDPFLSMYTTYPIYCHLLLGADVSTDIATASSAMEQEIIERTADIFRRVAPGLGAQRAKLVATVCKAQVKALISLVTSSCDKKFQKQVTAEVKRMLLAYLDPILGEGKKG
jgi:AcrR family transcriptional regulator